VVVYDSILAGKCLGGLGFVKGDYSNMSLNCSQDVPVVVRDMSSLNVSVE